MTYGCFNRKPYAKTLTVNDGRRLERIDERTVVSHQLVREVPFRMSTHCNYTHTELGRKDTECFGCMWRTHSGADKRTTKP